MVAALALPVRQTAYRRPLSGNADFLAARNGRIGLAAKQLTAVGAYRPLYAQVRYRIVYISIVRREELLWGLL